MSEQGIKVNNYERPVNLIEIANRGNVPGQQERIKKSSFKDMFSKELASSHELHFSKHASERMFSRGIELSDQKIASIANAIDKAGEKGAKETLVLTDDAALVVSVENRTVITVFNRDNLREGVVTSIDSAVIV